MTKIMDGLQIEITALRESIVALTRMVEEHDKSIKEHDKIIVRGTEGNPSMREDVRTLKDFMKSIKFWLTALAISFMGQFVVVMTAMVIYLIKAM